MFEPISTNNPVAYNAVLIKPGHPSLNVQIPAKDVYSAKKQLEAQYPAYSVNMTTVVMGY